MDSPGEEQAIERQPSILHLTAESNYQAKDYWLIQPAAIRALLLVLVGLAFGRIVINDFVDWDDGYLIYRNESNNPPLTAEKLAYHWAPSALRNQGMYDPLVFSVWWGLAHFAQISPADEILRSGLSPRVFHVANLLVHGLNVCIVLEILRRLGLPILAAGCGAAVFAIHPLQTEPVAWATGMKDLLSGLFALLAIWRYVCTGRGYSCVRGNTGCNSTSLVGAEQPGYTGKLGSGKAASHLGARESEGKFLSGNYALATFFFVLALLCKPSAVCVVLMVGAIDFLYFRKPWRKVALMLGPWVAISVVFIQISRNLQGHAEMSVPAWMRPGVAADALAFYLYKLVLPIHLSADYGRNPYALLGNPALHHAIYWTWIFPVLAALFVWRSRQPLVRLAGALVLMGLAPVLGIVAFSFQNYSTVADRYMYLPMLGVAIFVAWVMAKYSSRVVLAGFVGLLVVLGTLSFAQAGIWQNTRTLFLNSTSLNETRGRDYYLLGLYDDSLARVARERAAEDTLLNMTDSAAQHAQESQEYRQRAIGELEAAIERDRGYLWAYRVLIGDLMQLGRNEEGIAYARRLLEIQPAVDPEIQRPQERMHAVIAEALLRLNRQNEAADELRQNPGAIDVLRQGARGNASLMRWLDMNFPASRLDGLGDTNGKANAP